MAIRPLSGDPQNQWTTAQVTVTVRFAHPTQAAVAVPASKSPDDQSTDTANTDRLTNIDWVFREIDEWLSNPTSSRYFLLIGEPGTGKSFIANRLAQFSTGEANPPSDCPRLAQGVLHATHFCRVSNSASIDPGSFAGSISLQLGEKIPEFALALKDIGEKAINIDVHARVGVAKPGSNVEGMHIENLVSNGQEAFNRVVMDPLRIIYSTGYSHPVVILVDALDEALASSSENNIVDLLARTQGLNGQVRFILTSRSQPYVLERFKDARRLDLIADKPQVINLKTLVWLGRKEEALAHARMLTDAHKRFRGLLNIYDALRGRDQPDIDLLNEAGKVVSAIPDDLHRAEALSDLAATLAQAGHFAQAEDTAHAITDDWRRAWTLSKLASELAQAGHFERAEEVARAITDDWRRVEALSKLAAALAQSGDSRAREVFAQAEMTAHGIEDNWERTLAVIKLAVALAQAGDSRAKEAFAKAEMTARAIPYNRQRSEALLALANAMAQAGESRAREVFAQVEETARATADDWSRSEALLALTVALAQAHFFAQAEETANTIPFERQRAEGLGNLAAALAQAGHFAQSEMTARAIADDWQRAEALRKLAAALAQAGESRAREVFAQAEYAAIAIEGDRERTLFLTDLATTLAQAGFLAEAEETARAITM